MKTWVDAKGFSNVQLEAVGEIAPLVTKMAVGDGLAFYGTHEHDLKWHGTLKRVRGDREGKWFIFSEMVDGRWREGRARIDEARYWVMERAFENHGRRIAASRRVLVLRGGFKAVA